MFGSKHKSSGDVAGTGKRHQELEAQRKDEERQKEEVTEESKSFTTQEMARRFSLFEEAQDQNIGRYRKVAAGIHNTIQGYHVICDEK